MLPAGQGCPELCTARRAGSGILLVQTQRVIRRIQPGEDADLRDWAVIKNSIGRADHPALRFQGPPRDANARHEIQKAGLINATGNAVRAGLLVLAIRLRRARRRRRGQDRYAELVLRFHRCAVVFISQSDIEQKARHYMDVILDVGSHAPIAQAVIGVAAHRNGGIRHSGQQLRKSQNRG